jgi:hypothetical protein
MKSTLITKIKETFYVVFQTWNDQNVFEHFWTCEFEAHKCKI